MDTSEYWRETEILSLIRNREASIDYDKCEQTAEDNSIVEFPSRRTVRPVCRSKTELDQSCQHDEYIFDVDDRRSYRYQPATGGADCPTSCRGYDCYGDLVKEEECTLGAYLPDKEQCNCCGRCSAYQQLNQKCAEFKKTVHKVNGSNEIEVEEEFLEPGCDDGLVCRQGLCQDIHIVESTLGIRTRRDERIRIANDLSATALLKMAPSSKASKYQGSRSPT
ncbi:Uncharacterized protein OBRU01_11737 [Operophtera brumata]|uniref:Uncharacterized protein n=1 Tax=Operophtera brumata TaxID=104452 RepID=A0A0L7L1C9_OPEBR|nr:Uncharacterized protein OBRU01_11737 [Operophtera brumata]